MEEKFRQYRRFDWTQNANWQHYLENLYPTPSIDRLEKIRRKWYRDNIDRSFNPNYEQPQAQNPQPNINSQQRNNPHPQQQQQQQQRQPPQPQASNFRHQQNQPDVMPHLQSYQCICWILFLLSLPFRRLKNVLAIIGLLLGLVRKYGYPQFNQQFVMRAMYNDNFQGLLYMGIVLMIGARNMIMYAPLVFIGYLETAPFMLNYLQRNPNTPLISGLREPIRKSLQIKQSLLEMKSDMEIYIFIYMVIVWFIGRSHIISILMYFQLLRIRYMLLENTQAAFKRIDVKIRSYTTSLSCPLGVRNAYASLRDFLMKMGQVEQIRQGGMATNCLIF